MLLKITHETTLTYSDFIAETIMELRMAPRQSDDQLRLSFTLGVGPSANVTSHFDWLGNLVHVFTTSPPHKDVQIMASSIVETHRPYPNLTALPDVWPMQELDYSFHDYLQFGGPVNDSEELRDVVAHLYPLPGMQMGTLAMQMLRIIHTSFTYEKGVTTASTPVSDVLAHRRGVCQDFTHLMIAMSRALRIPARYVSGIIHSGKSALRGAAQTHAWVEMYFPVTGWIGFDPTNNTLVDDRFVTVALGRDYRDVPPNRGVYKGKAKEEMLVDVTTEALSAVPPHLAGEKIHLLRTRNRQGGSAAGVEQNGRMEEEQQQQQQQQQ